MAVTNRRAVWTAALAACGLLVIVLGFVIVVPHLLYPPLSAAGLRGVASARARIQLQQAQSQLANNARSALLQGLAGFVIVAGAAATWWQVHISRHGQLTGCAMGSPYRRPGGALLAVPPRPAVQSGDR